MIPDPATCYAALLVRDARYDGVFFTAVRTTGIYCRPVCPARPPLAKNCTFFATAAECVDAGYRACKRCRPEARPASPAWEGSVASVRRALKLIDDGALDAIERPAAIATLGNRLGVGDRQVRRLFARHAGTTPVAAAQAGRLARALALVEAGDRPMTEVAADAGFGSLRRFNELFRAVYGETPSARRTRMKGTRPMQLTLGRYAARVGDLLLVTDSDGALRALDFADFEARMTTLLKRHYGAVELLEGVAPAALTAALDRYFAGDLAALDGVAVATGGTEFQRSVWAALRAIPAGATTSYGALAARLGKPGASRAVGLANGLNPVGIVVPCHRVIGAGGALSGYAGGVQRKRWLLAHEGVNLPLPQAGEARDAPAGAARVRA